MDLPIGYMIGILKVIIGISGVIIRKIIPSLLDVLINDSLFQCFSGISIPW